MALVEGREGVGVNVGYSNVDDMEGDDEGGLIGENINGDELSSLILGLEL